ncbi:hypothetical protein H8356DRAFT_1354234 [Neocallimastix lanati (nom. inval.)]|nr:hypothetical protein H8356DRAFT_1354234 [Neocallimastix sp. JGI-2020a]
MSITEETNERIEINAKPLDLSGYAKTKEQKLISHWTNQLISFIFSNKISTITRPIFLLRHLNSSSRNTLAVNRCPNADTIQSIFNQLKNPSVFTWKNIIECLKSGSFSSIIKKEKDRFEEIDLTSIESFFLVLLYFICFARQDVNYQLEEPFSEILQLILKKETVFKRKNLRFESYVTGNSPKYYQSNVYFNEILDCIRLRNQNQSDYSQMELEQLSRLLQCSYYTFLEFSMFKNIKVLSKYAKNITPSWFTQDFLQTTLNLAKHEREKSINESCLKEILKIYVSSFLSMTLATDIIEFILYIMQHATLIICSAAEKLSTEYASRLSNILAELLSNDKQLWKDSKKINSFIPELAHFMKIIPYPGVISTTLINSWNLPKENYKLEAGLIGVGVIKKKKRNNINNGWLNEIIKSCDNKEKLVQSLYAMSGILKGFYPYTTDSFLKSNESYLVFDNMTKIFSQKILALLDKFEEIPGAKALLDKFEEIPEAKELIELDHKTFSKLFIDERLLKILFDNMINELRLDEDFFENMFKGSITKNDSYQQAFTKKLESPLFSSLGKQSWAFGVLLWNQIDHLENIYNLERRLVVEKRILLIYEGVYDGDNKSQKKREIDFRTCMILNSLNTFLYLHFVTISFGKDGFDVWRDVIEEIISQIEHLKPNGLIEDVVSQFKVEDININSSSMEKYRFIFFLYISKKLISHLSPPFVHQFIYRPITQFLSIQVIDPKNNSNNTNYDLFNSSHKICLSIFENPKNFKQLILSIANNYSNILIHNYPNKIAFQGIKQEYYSLIREPEQNNQNSNIENNLNSEECDIVVLGCLLKLTNKIFKYSKLVTSSSSNIIDTSNIKNNSYKAQLIIECIPVMEILLEIIKQIVLNNCIIINFNCQNIPMINHKNKELNDDNQCDIEDKYENGDEEEKMYEQKDNEKEKSILKSLKKIIIYEDLVPLNSQLWKSLYDTVSSTRLDRRKTERCVLWYLSLHSTKKNIYKELNNDDGLKSKKNK